MLLSFTSLLRMGISSPSSPSAALTALGFSRELAYSGLRISFGFDTSPEDVKKMAEALKTVLKNY